MQATANRNGHYLNFYDNMFHVSAKVFTIGEVMEVNPNETAATIKSFRKIVEGGTSNLFIPEYAVNYIPQFIKGKQYTTFAAAGNAADTTNVNINVKKRGWFLPFAGGAIFGAIATWFTIAYIVSKK